MATDLVTIATTAALTQFIGPSAKHIGELMLERAKQVGSKAVGLLAVVGRDPQVVEPKVLLPLVQAAALEADESLSEKWAALLANAADPSPKIIMHPGFIDVLRQLTPVDARALSFIYEWRERTGSSVTFGDFILHFIDNIGGDFELVYDNLLRLRLCELVEHRGASETDNAEVKDSYIACNKFGRSFLSAVAPPTA